MTTYDDIAADERDRALRDYAELERTCSERPAGRVGGTTGTERAVNDDMRTPQTVDEAITFFREWHGQGRIGRAGGLLVAEVERLRAIVPAYVDDGLTAAHARLAAARTVAAEAEEA